MSGRVVEFTPSPHQIAFELLPWLVNGTLSEAESAQVEQHIAGCAACRRERDWLQQLSGAYVESDTLVDVEQALARLEPRLALENPPEPRPVRPAQISSTVDWLRKLVAVEGNWLRLAFAMQLGVIIALGWALAVREPPAYRTLGSGARAQGSIVVVFDPATRERDLRRILTAAGARVVDGPTATNGYMLDVGDGSGAIARALKVLRAERSVILAQPLVAEQGQ